jgi:L,D-transpeptidase ErfK/SrfK
VRALWVWIGSVGLCALACAPNWGPSRAPHRVVEGLVIGQLQRHRVVEGDTLVELARTYGLGYVELVAANPGVDPWLPPSGSELMIPDAHLFPSDVREGLVINVAEQRLYWFSGERPRTYAIGVARDGWSTPLGRTTVVKKKENPVWFPTHSARADDPALGASVPPGPENPLGTHALYLGWPSYLIHGTNEPYGIGRRVSRGCVRLYPEDIVRLYPEVEVGTVVHVIEQTLKLGIVGGDIVLEAHPTLAQAEALEESGRFDAIPVPASLRRRLVALAGGDAKRIDWKRVESVAMRRRGVPIRVSFPKTASRSRSGLRDSVSADPNQLRGML